MECQLNAFLNKNSVENVIKTKINTTKFLRLYKQIINIDGGMVS